MRLKKLSCYKVCEGICPKYTIKNILLFKLQKPTAIQTITTQILTIQITHLKPEIKLVIQYHTKQQFF